MQDESSGHELTEDQDMTARSVAGIAYAGLLSLVNGCNPTELCL